MAKRTGGKIVIIHKSIVVLKSFTMAVNGNCICCLLQRVSYNFPRFKSWIHEEFLGK